jgi:hypothetical protein
MNFGLNSVNFRNVKHKIRFGPHRNGRISPKFELIRSNPRTLAPPRRQGSTTSESTHARRRAAGLHLRAAVLLSDSTHDAHARLYCCRTSPCRPACFLRPLPSASASSSSSNLVVLVQASRP